MKTFKPPWAILFDFVGVLMFPRAEYIPDGLVDAIDRTIGSVTDDDVFRRDARERYRLSEHDFNDILQQVVQKYEPFSQIWTLLPQLRQSFQLAIINNGTFLTYSAFQAELHLTNYFDLFVSSAREGVRKPDPVIYLRTCAYLRVQPQNCLFMDDSPENIAAASSLGMDTIYWSERWQGFHQFQQWLGRKFFSIHGDARL